jgi:hypothetical protein
LGILGVILGISGVVSAKHTNDKTSLGVAAIVLGVLSTLGAIFWVYLIQTSSCPHVYSYNGERYVLDADPLSGALFEAIEASDMDRLEHVKAVNGEYRIRVANEREELDHVNAVSLRIVDHPAAAEALPTQSGDVLQLTHHASPLSCTTAKNRDVLEAVVARDETAFSGFADDFDVDAADPPQEELVCEIPRPEGDDVALVLRGRSTEFAAEMFAHYLAAIGPGSLAMMRWGEDCEDYTFTQRINDEMARLGMGIAVQVWDGERWTDGGEIQPIGPAVLRSQAVPITLPAGVGPTVRVRLGMAPLLWEIDQLQLASSATAEVVEVTARSARDQAGSDRLGELAEADGVRVRLEHGQHVDVAFEAPPETDGRTRTVIMSITGYYEPQVGGRGYINPLALWRHRTGRDSLPRFALRRARQQ